MGQKLYFFTFSYPFGKGENWKAQELEYFASRFDTITVVPYSYDGNTDEPRSLPEGVECTKPLFDNLGFRVTLSFIFFLFNTNIFYYLKEFFVEKVYTKKSWLINWMNATAFCQRIQDHQVIKQIIKESDQNTIFYFFWGLYHSSIVPLLSKNRVGKIVVRFHGGDLYKERNNGYIPYRGPLLSTIDVAAPISELGHKYLHDHYSNTNLRSEISRIGVETKGQSAVRQDGVFRILSCANLIPLKRIGLIAEALASISLKVKWTHLGDGEMMGEMQEKVKSLPQNVSVHFTGWMQPQQVQKYYAEHSFDILINPSSTEGVPVAVMEALAAGIPVLATDVGGTAELVDESVGSLLPADLTAVLLAEAIEEYYKQSDSEKAIKRENAFSRYEQMADASVLAERMYKLLKD